jgi:hypothetical protein
VSAHSRPSHPSHKQAYDKLRWVYFKRQSFTSRDWEGHVICSECIVASENRLRRSWWLRLAHSPRLPSKPAAFSKIEFNGVGGRRAYTGEQL